ncbi:MAG: aspartyl protease family protein, partial [Chitinophagales bacterium]
RNIPPGGSHIFVKGSIQGVNLVWLIDTGASQSVIDKNFITQHFHNSIITETEHQTTGLGATYTKSTFIHLRKIWIGDFSIPSKKFSTLDLQVVNSAYESAGMPRIEAIIGGDILKRYKALIDYNKKYLRLIKS